MDLSSDGNIHSAIPNYDYHISFFTCKGKSYYPTKCIVYISAVTVQSLYKVYKKITNNNLESMFVTSDFLNAH